MTQHIEEAQKLEPVAWLRKCRVIDNGGKEYESLRFSSEDQCGFAVVSLSDAQAALAAAEERGRIEERERCAVAAVPITTGMRELRVSLIARAVRQSLRNYGHKVAEGTLPECIAADVERTLVADEKAWEAAPAKPPRDCGINGGDLLESRDNIGSAYTRSTTPPAITKEPTP